MTCEQTIESLERIPSEPGFRIPDAVEKHLEKCPECRALYAFLTGKADADELSPETRKRIENRLSASLKAVKPLPSGSQLSLGFFLIFAAVSAVFVAMSGVRGAAGLNVAQFAGILGIVGGVALLLAVTLSREMVPAEKKLFTSPTWFLLMLAALLIAAVSLFPWKVGANFLPASWHCFSTGFLYSGVAAGLMILYLGRGAPFSLGMAGAGAGLLAGLAGVVVLHFGCPMHSAPHIALGHLGVPFVGAILGYIIGHFLPHVMKGPGRS